LNRPGYEYAIGFYHGKRTFDGFADGGIIACAIIACQTRNISTCGVRDENLGTFHVFDEIEITGELPYDDGQYFYLPTSLDTSIMPLSPKQFNYNQNTRSSTL
jgi:Vanin C-terminal domain